MLYRIARGVLFPLIYLIFRPKIEGTENVPQDGKLIVYSNHSSIFDPIVLSILLPRQIHFMAKEELFRIPILRSILKKIGTFPVKRDKVDISAIKNSLRLLRNGKVLGIFPEGTRSKSGEVKEFERGVASIALRADSHVIPIAIIGGYRCFRPITVRVGKPINYGNEYDRKARGGELDKVSTAMRDALVDLMD